MKRSWIILILLAVVLTLVFWPDDRASKHEARDSAPVAEVTQDGKRHPNVAAERQTVKKDAPRLSDDRPRVVLDNRPRLPEEPANVYHSRLRLTEHWNECRKALELTEAKEHAILQALYDKQQMDSALMTGPGPAMTRDELTFAVEQIHRTHRLKIYRLLTDKQSWLWDDTVDCDMLFIFADRGALRMPGDTPHDLYWDRPFRDRVREMEPGGGKE